MAETKPAPPAITPGRGELIAFGLLMERAHEALAAAVTRAETAETELAALADRLGAAIRSAVATERERAEAAEAKAAEYESTIERVRDLGNSWCADDGQGIPTREMTAEADHGRTLLLALDGEVSGA